MSNVAFVVLMLFVTITVAGFLMASGHKASSGQEDYPFVWNFLIPLGTKRCYGLAITSAKYDFPSQGEWSVQFYWWPTKRSWRYNGEWVRKGRVIILWSAPKRDPKTEFRPGFNFS